MKHPVFVPLTDDLLDRNPELLFEPLVPYHPDLPCYHHLVPAPEADPSVGAKAARRGTG